MPLNLNLKQYFYLLLMLLGGGYTFFFVLQGIMAHNGSFNTLEFIQSTWIDNYYAKSLTLDFWTLSIAGTFFVIAEGLRLKMKRIWLYVVLIFMVAIAFGFPLFLFMREFKLRGNLST
jgi:Terpene cyclase DEP1